MKRPSQIIPQHSERGWCDRVGYGVKVKYNHTQEVY